MRFHIQYHVDGCKKLASFRPLEINWILNVFISLVSGQMRLLNGLKSFCLPPPSGLFMYMLTSLLVQKIPFNFVQWFNSKKSQHYSEKKKFFPSRHFGHQFSYHHELKFFPRPVLLGHEKVKVLKRWCKCIKIRGRLLMIVLGSAQIFILLPFSHGSYIISIVVKLLWWNRKDFWQEVSMAKKVDCPANWAFVPYCVHQPHHHHLRTTK